MPAIPELGFSGGNSLGITMIVAVVFFFLVMIARKQLGDWFNIEVNLIYAGIGAAVCVPVTFFFGLKFGFFAGLFGLIIGIVAGMFFSGGGE